MDLVNKARLLALILSIILLLNMLCACDLFPSAGFPLIEGSGDASSVVYINGKRTELAGPEKLSSGYLLLSTEERMIYSAAYTALLQYENEFEIKKCDHAKYIKSYAEALTVLFNDHPEFFWLSGSVKAKAEYSEGSSIGNVGFKMEIYDYWRDADIRFASESLELTVKDIAGSAMAYESDFERIKYVHDRIILNTEYDIDTYEQGEDAELDEKALCNTSYGALVRGKALCGGYSRAFSVVMHEMGYECEYITGTTDGGPHAWNLVKLGGEYYHVDLTWDDLDGDPCALIYSYLCLPDDEMYRTHTIDKSFENYTASSNTYNYHVYTGLYLDELSYSALAEMAERYDGSGCFSIKCKRQAVLDMLFDELISREGTIKLFPELQLDGYRYITDEKLLILTLILE